MSVAEALNTVVRPPTIGPPKYTPGLQLDDQWVYTPEEARRPKEDVNDSINTLHLNRVSNNQNKGTDSVRRGQFKEAPNRSDIERIDKKEKVIEDPWRLPLQDNRANDYEGPRKRETDLFLDTLGGPNGTVVRRNGHPPLSDPWFQKQQQEYQNRHVISRDGQKITQHGEYRHDTDQASDIGGRDQLYRHWEISKDRDRYHTRSGRGIDKTGQMYNYSAQDIRTPSKLSDGRSLEIESSKGGAGAPIKDPWGKHVTRMPITLSRDDFGESTITEDIPGKATFDLDFTNQESKPYYPWGTQGGGAPIRNRDGSIVTQVFGKLQEQNSMDVEMRRKKRRQEVLCNELKECARQQQENRDELTRYMKAPQVELAELLLAGRVGKPRRDEITGEVTQHHLPNSDVSRWRSNYQPIPSAEKKRYHDELVKMAEERQLQKQLEKLKERQESQAHFQNMDSTWGGFGGGAPKHQMIRKKINLNNSLFYPEQLQENQGVDAEYMPLTGLGSFEYQQFPASENRLLQPSPFSSSRITKSSIRSSHKNQYDTSGDYRLPEFTRNYLPPYATD